MSATIHHDYAEVNGVRLHYAHARPDASSAGAKPELILFLHGFPEFWYCWRKQLAEFGRDHLAVAPDLRGYNLSSKPREMEQYQMRHLVEDVRQLARHLGYERFTLVGHDWGGVVACAYALAHPDDLVRLILINAPHPSVFRREIRHNPRQRRASAYMLLLRTRLAEPLLSVFNYWLLGRGLLTEGVKRGYFTEEDKAAYLAAWSQPGSLTGGLNYYRAMRTGPSRGGEAFRSDDLPESMVVRAPTLVIWGERDPYLLTGLLDGLEEFVLDLTVRREPEGSHWIIHEMPDVVSRHIREFLARR